VNTSRNVSRLDTNPACIVTVRFPPDLETAAAVLFRHAETHVPPELDDGGIEIGIEREKQADISGGERSGFSLRNL